MTPPAKFTRLDPPDPRCIPPDLPGLPPTLVDVCEAACAAVARVRRLDAEARAAQIAAQVAANTDAHAAAATPDAVPPETAPAARQAVHDAERALAGAHEAEKRALADQRAAVKRELPDWRPVQRDRLQTRGPRIHDAADKLDAELAALELEETVLWALDRFDRDGWLELDLRNRGRERQRAKAAEHVAQWAQISRAHSVPMNDTPHLLAALRLRGDEALDPDAATYRQATGQ